MFSTTKLSKKEPLPPLPPPPQIRGNPNPNGGTSHLSREEVIRRRHSDAKKLERIYRDLYWSLVEEVRAKHREYLWTVGASPEAAEDDDDDEDDGGGEGLGNGGKKRAARDRCAFGGCKSVAMPLSRFCHQHVLCDREQTLYKGCIYVTRSDVACNKPILRAVVRSLCPAHFQSTQKQLSKALKKAGVNMCSSSRATGDFNAILLECVHRIQAKRTRISAKRRNMNATVENITEKDKNVQNEVAGHLSNKSGNEPIICDIPCVHL